MRKNKWLVILVAISAIMIAGSAAFFSVTGLGVLFSGAAIAVMIMAGSLEFAKLVTATYLKQEWDTIKGINKWYLTSAVVILMAITSAGIFGYLSNAFQQQNLKLDQVQREISVWQNKIDYTNQQIATLQGQQKDLTSTQNSLIQKGNVNSRLLKSVDNRDKQTTTINKKINSLQDSVVVYNAHINDIKNNNIGIEREVGGFRFVAEAFGVELKTVVKFFIILIVIVFDPLAVALIIAFNGLLQRKDEKIEETKNEEVTPNKIDAADLVSEISRIRLSENDLKKLEEVLLNPPAPNEALIAAAEEYKEKVEQKPWANLPDETWERMKKIEADREAKFGPMDPEDEPTALANSGLTEKEELYDEPFDTPLIKEEPILEEPIVEEPVISYEFEMKSNLEKIRQDLENDDEPKVDVFEKSRDAELNQKALETIQNSNIEEILSQVFVEETTDAPYENDFTESEIKEEISQNVKQDEPQTKEIPVEDTTQLETETLNQDPTSLEDEKKN
jgi:Protein of unknown function (DUF1778)